MPMTSWGEPTSHEPTPGPGDRAVAPVKWPHPGWPTLAMIGIWVVGMFIAVFVPALIVPPTEVGAPGSKVLLAFLATVVGAIVMAVVGSILHKWHNAPLAWSFGLVPAVAVVIGGMIIAMTKLF
ncbi:MAG: hypothetical protein ACLGIA_11940 [Actinomycetes bacterium]